MESGEREGMRLQRWLAQAGVASRRHAEEMIAAGRVQVNGETVTRMGVVVGEGDSVTLDGAPVKPAAKHHYYAFHKPSCVVTTLSDPEGRKAVGDFLEGVEGRVFPVGRLDYLTEGLLILTDDGDWANAITHPSREVEKEYIILVEGVPSEETMDKLRHGIMLPGDTRPTAVAKVELMFQDERRARLRVTIHEGRNRQVRRMLQTVGHEPLWLQRSRVGAVRLGDLASGAIRPLTAAELSDMSRLIHPVSTRNNNMSKK